MVSPPTLTVSTSSALAVDRHLLPGAHQDDVTGLQIRDRHRPLAGRRAQRRRLRHRSDECGDRGAGAIGIQIGDEFGDQDNRHQHRSGNVLSGDQRDACRHRDEDLGADLALVNEIEDARFQERIDADGHGDQQHPQGQRPAPVEQGEHADEDDSRRLALAMGSKECARHR